MFDRQKSLAFGDTALKACVENRPKGEGTFFYFYCINSVIWLLDVVGCATFHHNTLWQECQLHTVKLFGFETARGGVDMDVMAADAVGKTAVLNGVFLVRIEPIEGFAV
jgi:hypothetical protein